MVKVWPEPTTNRASCQVRGSSINDVTVLGGGAQGFCDDSTKALLIKRVRMWGGGSKIIQNRVSLFMDDLLVGLLNSSKNFSLIMLKS